MNRIRVRISGQADETNPCAAVASGKIVPEIPPV